MAKQGAIDRDALTRRDFLKLLGAGGLALAFTPFIDWGKYMPNPDTAVPKRQQVILSDGTHANVNTFPINHQEIITYPSTADPVLNKEAFRQWNLIRLPAYLGGNANDVTAFRVYSSVCVHLWCVWKYVPVGEKNGNDKGRYLLRTNLCEHEAAELWQFYIQLVEIEAAFKNLKDDLALRPIFHQLEHRIEAHIFVAFMAYCLHVTLRARLRPLAPGLTPRAVLDKFATIQMLDVHFPTTDGRTLILSRYTHPEPDHRLLLEQLNLTLPAQPPPRISSRGKLLNQT